MVDIEYLDKYLKIFYTDVFYYIVEIACILYPTP